MQNGASTATSGIAPIVDAERAIPGVTYVVTVIDRPGVIKQDSTVPAASSAAPMTGAPTRRLKPSSDAAKAAKIDIALSDKIPRDRRQKFIFLSATCGATAVTRQPDGSDPRRS